MLLDPVIAEGCHAVVLPSAEVEFAQHPGAAFAVARVEDDRTARRQRGENLRQIPSGARVSVGASFGVEIVIERDEPSQRLLACSRIRCPRVRRERARAGCGAG